jgi:hypothetical protein
MTPAMLHAAASVTGAALPTALQLLAIMLFVDRRGRAVEVSRRMVFIAALACTAAMYARLEAVWAMLAITVWLIARQPRWLWTYAGYQAGMIVVTAAFFHLASDGRFVQTVDGLGFEPNDGRGGLLRTLVLLLVLVRDHAPATWVLIPLAVFGLVLRTMRGRWHIVHIALVACGVSLLVSLARGTAGPTVMLDTIVLGAICAADLWRVSLNGARAMGPAQAVMAVLLLWSTVGGLAMHVRADALGALNVLLYGRHDSKLSPRPLAGLIGPDDALLTEDPSLAVAMGRHPVVLDPWMLKRIGDQRPAAVDRLVARIERGDFDAIVLLRKADAYSPWYREVNLGSAVVGAIEAHYRRLAVRHGFEVYVPSGRRDRMAGASGDER